MSNHDQFKALFAAPKTERRAMLASFAESMGASPEAKQAFVEVALKEVEWLAEWMKQSSSKIGVSLVSLADE